MLCGTPNQGKIYSIISVWCFFSSWDPVADVDAEENGVDGPLHHAGRAGRVPVSQDFAADHSVQGMVEQAHSAARTLKQYLIPKEAFCRLNATATLPTGHGRRNILQTLFREASALLISVLVHEIRMTVEPAGVYRFISTLPLRI